ncbi:hypothetical protein BDR06DRAFT_1012496 [Suillus hirtellus]|nr:hypothetical protein BDR06DRAFT_1012496 [Suillus hirtellus]
MLTQHIVLPTEVDFKPNNVLFDEGSAMMEENSPQKILTRSRHNLMRVESYFVSTDCFRGLQSEMVKYGLFEAEAIAAAAFIHACLHFDPEERYSASDVFEHP